MKGLILENSMTASEMEAVINKKYAGIPRNTLTLNNAIGSTIDTSSLAYQFTIDTLTYLSKKVVEQKFYEIDIGKFLNVDYNVGGYSSFIQTWAEVYAGSGFTAGKIKTGATQSRLAQNNAGLVGIMQKTQTWAQSLDYTLFDIRKAAEAGAWGVVEAKMKSLTKDWQLGIQKNYLLGDPDDVDMTGLLNQPSVTVNTGAGSVITAKLTTLSDADFITAVKGLVPAYLRNNPTLQNPDTFAISPLDYAELAGQALTTTFPIANRLEYLENAMSKFGVKVEPLAYCDSAYNSDVLTMNRYVLYRKNGDGLLAALPVDLQFTAPATRNNFQFEQVGFGLYAAVVAARPLEMLYFDF